MSFISGDKFVASEEFIALAREIDKHAITHNLKPADIYFSPKVIPKYDVAKEKKGGAAFTKKRAILIKSRSRMPPAGSRMKMVIMLRLYKDLPEEFDADIKDALKAIERHNLRADKLINTSKEVAKKTRDVLAKAFDKNLDAVEKVLLSAGIKSKDLAIGQSMMGKTMIVKLPNGGFVSIGKADEEKFKKAKEPAPAPGTTGAFGRPKASAAKPATKEERKLRGTKSAKATDATPSKKRKAEAAKKLPSKKVKQR